MIFKKTVATAIFIACAGMTSHAFATNIVINGSFENGNTGFTSGYALGSLFAAGVYVVGSNPQNYHPQFAGISAEDGTNMMIINGASTSGVPVWTESGLTVAPNTKYYFSTWVASVTPLAPANLQFSINGSNVGTLQATSSTDWQQFYTTWNSGNATNVNISLVNLNTEANGNDFALDNIAFDTVSPTSAAVPEPASLALLGLGLAGISLIRRQKTKG